MKTGWESKKDIIARGVKISATKKLEGFRLINELADKILSKKQKALRQKLRAA